MNFLTNFSLHLKNNPYDACRPCAIFFQAVRKVWTLRWVLLSVWNNLSNILRHSSPTRTISFQARHGCSNFWLKLTGLALFVATLCFQSVWPTAWPVRVFACVLCFPPSGVCLVFFKISYFRPGFSHYFELSGADGLVGKLSQRRVDQKNPVKIRQILRKLRPKTCFSEIYNARLLKPIFFYHWNQFFLPQGYDFLSKKLILGSFFFMSFFVTSKRNRSVLLDDSQSRNDGNMIYFCAFKIDFAIQVLTAPFLFH